MKQFKLGFWVLLAVLMSTSMNAQDKNNPIAVTLGTNAVDFYPANIPGMTTPAGSSTVWYDNFFNANAHYNAMPAINSLSVGGWLGKGFVLEGSVSFNNITQLGNIEIDDEFYMALGALVKYDFSRLTGSWGNFEPYVAAGGGYVTIGENNAATLDGGAGINFWFNDKVGVTLNTKYKHTLVDDPHVSNPDVALQHWQHTLGFIFKFGGTDTDGDGVYDKFDACPDVPGLEQFDGCPDTDGDGIIDSEDRCPDVAGLESLQGCPDADGDGIADIDDRCPDARGTAENQGCPDTDEDGIVDIDDECPKQAGPKENNGCPWPDADNDGVFDKDDACPKHAGPASNNGCPVLSEDLIAEMHQLFGEIFFEFGNAEFRREVPEKLDRIAEIMEAHPSYTYSFAGHTDSVGSKKRNQELSEERAMAVKNYLAGQGIDAAKMATEGFGEEKPIESNATQKGRDKNRRVELTINN